MVYVAALRWLLLVFPYINVRVVACCLLFVVDVFGVVRCVLLVVG